MSTPARAAVLLALSALAGCGPNYRYVYDGESAFERCYGLDYDSTVGDPARASCWSAWLQSYSYGANPDRVDFARNRLSALGTPDRRPPTAATSGAAVNLNAGATAAAAPSAPATALTVDVERTAPAAPASPAAPAASPWSGRMSTGGNPVNAPPPTHQDETGAQPPGATCAHDCRTAWSSATARCPRQDAACVARGDEGYRECMRGCF